MIRIGLPEIIVIIIVMIVIFRFDVLSNLNNMFWKIFKDIREDMQDDDQDAEKNGSSIKKLDDISDLNDKTFPHA